MNKIFSKGCLLGNLFEGNIIYTVLVRGNERKIDWRRFYGAPVRCSQYRQVELLPRQNMVYLELLRRGYQVYVGTTAQGEVDFVAKDEKGLAYYQVSESTQQPEVLERELNPLKSIRDQYPKTLLTLDEINAEADYNGIQKRNALQWMLDVPK